MHFDKEIFIEEVAHLTAILAMQQSREAEKSVPLEEEEKVIVYNRDMMNKLIYERF